jgi:hypothetical protein
MSEISSWHKEELYDVIAALSATIRELKNEIVELQSIQYELTKEFGKILVHDGWVRN